MRSSLLLLAPLLMLLLAPLGCTTTWHGIVVRNAAPVYADDDCERVTGYAERLDDVYLGRRGPGGDDPVAVKFDGRKGYMSRRDLRVFSVDSDKESKSAAIFRARRGVDLEGRDWPEARKRAIREDRVERGMSREMVALAWGAPDGSAALGDGGERWTYERTRYDTTYDTSYAYAPMRVSVYGGYGYGYGGYRYGAGRWGAWYGPGWYGPGWGYDYYPVTTRTTVITTDRRSVTFDPEGRVIGFDNTSR